MDSDSEEEIFFGPVTDREKQVALKFYEKFPGELRISSCLTYDIPGNIADVLPNRNLDETSARNSTVSEDLVSIMDESKESIMLETDVGNPSDVLPDRILVESSVGNSAVSEDKVYISDESKHGIILETNVENPADVSPDRILDESPAANSTVSEDVMCISEEGKHVVMLGTNGGNHSDVLPNRNLDETSARNSTVSEDLVSIMDESKESIMLETDVGNPSDVLPNRNLDDSSARNSVSEDLALIMGESKEAIMLETDDGNPSDVVSHIVELESFEQTSPVPEAFASPHGDMSEECTKLEDKREEETSEESSVTAEKMSLSPLHHECFCITLEANANKLSDFDWLQENSHTSEALVCPLNDGRKLGIVLERELSVMLPEKTKDESSEGNYLTQASAPPQNYKNEHSNTLENAEIESGNTENEEDKNIAEESLTIVDSRMSEDGIQIVEDCEGMEKVVSSGKCLHHKTSSKKEVEGNLKEMSNIFSMTLTIDDSKDIQVPEFCLSDEEEPENDLNNTLDLVNTIMLEHLYQSCSPSKLADLKRSIQHSVAAAQHRHDTVNLISDDDYSFTDYDDDHGGGENEERDDNKGSVETSYCRNVDPVLDVLKVDKAGSDCNSFNESSHEENRNDVAVSNNFEEHASSGQKGIERKSPDVELPVKCPSKFDYSSLKVKRRSPASREKHFQKSPCQKVLHASTPRYRALESPLQSYLRSEPTLIQIVKPKFKTPRNIKNFCCLEAAPDVTSPKESSVYPKRSLISPNTLPVVRYRSHPTVDINGPGTPIAATGPCEKVPGAITPIVTKHIGHVKIVNSGSPLKLAEPRLSIVQSSFAGRSDTLGGHTEASGKLSPSKFVGHRIPILKPNPAGRADMLLGKSKKEGVVGSKTELTPKRRGEL